VTFTAGAHECREVVSNVTLSDVPAGDGGEYILSAGVVHAFTCVPVDDLT